MTAAPSAPAPAAPAPSSELSALADAVGDAAGSISVALLAQAVAGESVTQRSSSLSLRVWRADAATDLTTLELDEEDGDGRRLSGELDTPGMARLPPGLIAEAGGGGEVDVQMVQYGLNLGVRRAAAVAELGPRVEPDDAHAAQRHVGDRRLGPRRAHRVFAPRLAARYRRGRRAARVVRHGAVRAVRAREERDGGRGGGEGGRVQPQSLGGRRGRG